MHQVHPYIPGTLLLLAEVEAVCRKRDRTLSRNAGNIFIRIFNSNLYCVYGHIGMHLPGVGRGMCAQGLLEIWEGSQ